MGMGSLPAAHFHHQRDGDLPQLLGWRAVHSACDGLETGTADDQLGGGGQPLRSLTDRKRTAAHRPVLTPGGSDFGPVPINSASTTSLFAVTNLVAGGSSVTVATPAVTGDFSVSNAASGGVPCGGALAYTASCFVAD